MPLDTNSQMHQMLKSVNNLLMTAKDSVKQFSQFTGTILVNEEVAHERNSICEKCDSYQVSNKKCAECGCYVRVKSMLTAAKCPIGKW